MNQELNELLETAIYKEIASEALYIAGQKSTDDPGARSLMKELAEDEFRHSQMIKGLKESAWKPVLSLEDRITNLMISDYITAPEKLEAASLQDTLAFALKREQQSVQFYSRMMGLFHDEDARYLCRRLIREELKHKLKLERLYDDLFLGEN